VKNLPARRPLRRTLHVEQVIDRTVTGQRMQEMARAVEEQPDGSKVEVERETIEDRTDACPWVSTGTVKTRTKRTRPA
jgi:hypothetical protein